MGRGRYDLSGGLLKGGALEAAVHEPALTAVAGAALHYGWDSRGR
jgi:hypothetical protein